MRRYETIYIIRPNVSEDDMTAIIDRTNEVIEKFDGKIVQLDRWGIKKLAYLIQKQTQGYYIYCEYAGASEAVDEIERLFRIDDKVLKYMTIKTQEEFSDDYNPRPVRESKSHHSDDDDDVIVDDDDDDDD
nr:30S ribosomal protein S6 [Desulfobulbaceae bacterium]